MIGMGPYLASNVTPFNESYDNKPCIEENSELCRCILQTELSVLERKSVMMNG